MNKKINCGMNVNINLTEENRDGLKYKSYDIENREDAQTIINQSNEELTKQEQTDLNLSKILRSKK